MSFKYFLWLSAAATAAFGAAMDENMCSDMILPAEKFPNNHPPKADDLVSSHFTLSLKDGNLDALTTVKKGQPVTLVLAAKKNDTIAGFLMEVRTEGDDIVGTFEDHGDVKAIKCPGSTSKNAATHNADFTPTAEVTVTAIWTAPDGLTDGAELKAYFTVANTTDTVWAKQEGSAFTYSKPPPPATPAVGEIDCETMKLTGETSPQEGKAPHTFNVSSTVVKSGTNISITLTGTEGTTNDFQGFLIEVRQGKAIVGHFTVDGGDAVVKSKDCSGKGSNSSVTHKDGSTAKHEVSAIWKTPKGLDDGSELKVYFTVANNDKVYWAKQEGITLKYRGASGALAASGLLTLIAALLVGTSFGTGEF